MTFQTVFVYGTLRKGQPNRPVVEPYLVSELGVGQIRAAMYDWGFCPAVTFGRGRSGHGRVGEGHGRGLGSARSA